MIVVLDTSALIKLFIDESGSEALLGRVRGQRLAVSPLAAAESYATFARRHREGLLTVAEHAELESAFVRDWRSFWVVPAEDMVVGLTAEICRRHPLRGADALHLATALSLAKNARDVTFASADARLVAAAVGEGLEVFVPAP